MFSKHPGWPRNRPRAPRRVRDAGGDITSRRRWSGRFPGWFRDTSRTPWGRGRGAVGYRDEMGPCTGCTAPLRGPSSCQGGAVSPVSAARQRGAVWGALLTSGCSPPSCPRASSSPLLSPPIAALALVVVVALVRAVIGSRRRVRPLCAGGGDGLSGGEGQRRLNGDGGGRWRWRALVAGGWLWWKAAAARRDGGGKRQRGRRNNG